jgi:amino acid permease
MKGNKVGGCLVGVLLLILLGVALALTRVLLIQAATLYEEGSSLLPVGVGVVAAGGTIASLLLLIAFLGYYLLLSLRGETKEDK